MGKKRNQYTDKTKNLKQYNLIYNGGAMWQIYATSYKKAWDVLRPKMKKGFVIPFQNFSAMVEVGGYPFVKNIAMFEKDVTEEMARKATGEKTTA